MAHVSCPAFGFCTDWLCGSYLTCTSHVGVNIVECSIFGHLQGGRDAETETESEVQLSVHIRWGAGVSGYLVYGQIHNPEILGYVDMNKEFVYDLSYLSFVSA